MKTKVILLLIAIIVSSPAFAQKVKGKEKGKTATKTEVVKADSVVPNNNVKMESQVEELDDVKMLRQENKLLKEKIVKLQGDTAKFRHDNADQQKRLKSIEKGISSMDAIVYKQCLLFPLEKRFNKGLIEDCLMAVNAFAALGGNRSKDFNECKKVYYPLLNEYEKYNTEMISFIEKQVVPRIPNGEIIPSHRESLVNKLKAEPYYRNCYINRNKPPYNSIPYLDEAIDKLFKMLNKTGNVESELQELLRYLEPKKIETP